MKTKIKELIERFKTETLELPSVLLLSPDDLAELRDELDLVPEKTLATIYGLDIIIIND